MKIGIDARMIDHPGIGRYISSLIPEVARQARKKDSFVLFGDPLKLRDLAEEPNVRIVPWDAPIYSIREQIEHPYGREDIDLVHFPHFNIPVFYRKKMVVTIHDLIYVLFPESVPSAAAKHYARFMIGKALKNAGSVISVSKHTKDDLVKVYGPSYAGKIRVIYEAADKRFQRVEDEDRIEEVRKKYSLSRDIVLYVGSIKPHKNVKKLIEIYSKVKSWGVPHELVLAGRWDSKEDHLKEAIDDNKDIRYIGEVPLDDLVVLYSMAGVVVNLSLYEGFGLTPLEAMQCGAPVVVSNTTSVPEVVGDAAFVVSPFNIGQISDTIYNVLVNEKLRIGMMESGFDHARRFSWERTARETLDVYHSNE